MKAKVLLVDEDVHSKIKQYAKGKGMKLKYLVEQILIEAMKEN